MERVLPIQQECRVAEEVFPLIAWFGAVGSPERRLGGRRMACSMPELLMVLALPGTHFVGSFHTWNMGQCTADTFLSGNLHLWNMDLDTADTQFLGILHMDWVALLE